MFENVVKSDSRIQRVPLVQIDLFRSMRSMSLGVTDHSPYLRNEKRVKCWPSLQHSPGSANISHNAIENGQR